ncbi:unnamed protein product [Trifolium pratense]|uniref:Uncharacterized protein n=1 Tax=Trifolium pratense TaxID=57577 RepID=A0ACB0JAT1_TRIPR|nr:unnamed protein product [Trifolium pratense]
MLLYQNKKRKVGNGEKTLFWKDDWFESGALRYRFPMLVELSLGKDMSVAEIWRLRWGVGGGGWQCRRRIFV